MNDFPDDDRDDFIGREPDDVSGTNRALGLVVPPRARVIHDKDGNLIWDELAEMELAFRKAGRPCLEFYDEQWRLENIEERRAARRGKDNRQ